MELLVVVGILVILTVISVPVTARVREYAANIRCVKNLKELGHGIILFTLDNNGRMPPHMENPPGVFFRGQVPSWGPTWGEYIVKIYLNGNKQFFFCPFRPKTWGEAAEYYLDYAYNDRFYPKTSDQSEERLGLIRNTITNPATVILLGDCARYSGTTPVGGYYSMQAADRLFPRHPGSRVNVLYLDLHVENHHYIRTGTLPPVDHPLGTKYFKPQL